MHLDKGPQLVLLTRSRAITAIEFKRQLTIQRATNSILFVLAWGL